MKLMLQLYHREVISHSIDSINPDLKKFTKRLDSFTDVQLKTWRKADDILPSVNMSIKAWNNCSLLLLLLSFFQKFASNEKFRCIRFIFST
jgi:hypothetical protein